jgi:transposase-like protein
MAEDRIMTPAGVVARAMAGEHGDLLRDAVAMVVRELMEAEVAQLTGAGRGERAEGRVTHLNGYRQRAWETRAGEIDLATRARGRGRRTSRASLSRGGAVSRRSSAW